jgi:hypothetical protein
VNCDHFIFFVFVGGGGEVVVYKEVSGWVGPMCRVSFFLVL